jgi:hypothetical protein
MAIGVYFYSSFRICKNDFKSGFSEPDEMVDITAHMFAQQGRELSSLFSTAAYISLHYSLKMRETTCQGMTPVVYGMSE